MYTKVLIEAIFVGILLVVVGMFTLKTKKIVPLFLTGALVHIICEIVGLNKWYCKNGSACTGLKN
jgi:hypothetical protein